MTFTINKELFLLPLIMLFLAVLVLDIYGFAGDQIEIIRLFEWMLAGSVMWIVV